jgi:adenylylsulfate kinase
MLLIMAGLPGTGKSTLARALASHTGGAVLDKDTIRAALFGDAVEYSPDQDDFVLDVMLQTAMWIVARDRRRPVIIDGRVFSRNAQLAVVTGFADKIAVDWHVIECICLDETARRRLEEDRARGTHLAGNRTWELYLEVKRRFEPIPEPKTVINTDLPLDQCVAAVMRDVGR